MSTTNFDVTWSNLSYQIQPSRSSFDSFWTRFERKSKYNLVRLQKLVFFGTGDSYDLTCHVRPTPKPITILRHLNGSFKSAELTAILGPSGAGKTSLLNFLARRQVKGYTGKLEVSKTERPLKISTIPQENFLPDYLTVKENLLYASRLNNCDKSFREHEEDCARVAQLLGIEQCLELQTKSISGGQHKRLAIAQELLTKPDILILDEPTSGLDSLTCLKTVSVLKDLVESSRKKLIDPIAIVLTIHQPPQDVFNLFDKVYVMATGGVAIYDGPPNLCSTHITNSTGIEPPYTTYNQATFAVDVASGKHGQEAIKELEQQVWLKSKQIPTKIVNDTAKLRKHFEAYSEQNSADLCIDQKMNRGSVVADKGNFLKKTIILSSRYWKSIYRDPKLFPIIVYHIVLPAIMSMIMGSEPGKAKACPKFKSHYSLAEIVSKNDSLTSNSVQDELELTLENLGLIFTTIYGMTAVNIASITLSFALDLRTSLKEHYNGWYSMSSYLAARFITDIPLTMVLPLLCMSVFYPLTGQLDGMDFSDSHRILITAMAMVLGLIAGQTMAMIVGAIYTNHLTTAMFVSQAITMPMVFLSGFVVRTKNLSRPFLYGLTFTSIYRHMMEVAVAARYGYNLCKCNDTAITGKAPEMTGVSDKLRRFTQEMIGSVEEDSEETTNATIPPPDVFSVMAKQISLYNTYGVEVKSCADVRPHQLDELSVSETNIPIAFLSLLINIVVLVIVLFMTVKFLTKFRTSL